MAKREGGLLSQGYGIIPNVVLYSVELTDKQKLLFCLISSLCAKEGFCWATNDYLGKLLGASKITISKNISVLQELGFINVEISHEDGNVRKITMIENDGGYSQKGQEGIVKNDNSYIYTNITNEYYNFEKFWKDYPHSRKGKKAESEKYFKQNDSLEVKKQVQILKWQIKAGLQDAEFVPACERWIRDFTPLNDDVIKQKLVKICKRHLKEGGDMKQRSHELKETFGEKEINEIVKAIQQKDNTKNLFIKP